uniref:Transcription factor IIIC subunit 5 HTH domain-containing protein n=1 Tax=Chromera velia CCMP2878 TaxID=1169474 RepID=A0A0G4G6T7_9ALVE|mmetsp:Transcript_29580/g.58018  ORF Transcript_29580/g.58018 Transcript_29580/m.58018 type:complete len:513 (+) Transcript_29580:160-1698(+)|eukprot:Cvel_20560.t1-p1 / transcript=Cvel_20560.t1 / gene=Cvel_20560 / organism=Chromera_velia_CCMP2878 / gene_product=General transcription factor 3C polypeptide 5, putative / transcript_product=General transcription factor 3C polypeptide 5, putative / location=Cvel_scaffold1856:15615-19620(-) / protein_length=512 / sequence_SO=supercontig / SO=protein_coding / is_pseudo=false
MSARPKGPQPSSSSSSSSSRSQCVHLKIPPGVLLACVEVPGTVKKESAVIEALGGLEAVASSCENPKKSPLVIDLDPKDPFSKHIEAKTIKSAALALKVKKKINRKTGQLVSVTYEILGRVSPVFIFTDLCDYYHIPPAGARESVSRPLDVQIDDTVLKEPYLPPPFFTRTAVSFSYQFKENAFLPKKARRRLSDTAAAADGEKGVLQTQRGEALTAIMPTKPEVGCPKWTLTAEIPKPIQEPLPQSYANSAATDTLLRAYRELFDERPLWLRHRLEVALTEKVKGLQNTGEWNEWRRRWVLRRVAYICYGGPWGRCLGRRGYDPRQDPEARHFQVIDFRDPYFRTLEVRSSARSGRGRTGGGMTMGRISAPQSASPSPLPVPAAVSSSFFPPGEGQAASSSASQPQTGGTGTGVAQTDPEDERNVDPFFVVPPIQGSQAYQLCDIDDFHVKNVIAKATPLAQFSPLTGWLSREVLQEIRECMKVKAARMREGLSTLPPDAAAAQATAALTL